VNVLGMHACTRVSLHDKLSCTRLQNYTIGASLLSESVPWNSSLWECKVLRRGAEGAWEWDIPPMGVSWISGRDRCIVETERVSQNRQLNSNIIKSKSLSTNIQILI